MNFLFDKHNHFNIANLATFVNIACGVLAIYFLTHSNFLIAAVFAWIAGAFDIVDGKIARKYSLSTEFGIQLDSFADFLSFVIVPTMFVYFAIIDSSMENLSPIFVAFTFCYYVISALRRLISFNIDSNEGEVQKFFVGIPTPLGAILLWAVYLVWLTGVLNENVVLAFTILIGYLLNSKIKIPHL